jgi:hypothetical protein
MEWEWTRSTTVDAIASSVAALATAEVFAALVLTIGDGGRG